jgi:hypothetical protein
VLDPGDRRLLREALRPPPGARLDAALGTTFSLDLGALIYVPLAFAFFEADDGVNVGPDPLALLESVRRHSDRILIACEAGRISVPERYKPITCYLEQMVVGVRPSYPGRRFHPKVWLLRFIHLDSGIRSWRLVSFSRNMTFDHSWDTALGLDGTELKQRSPELAKLNAPIVRLLRAIPNLAVSPIDRKRHQLLDEMVGRLDRVRFEAPPGFDIVGFHAFGVGKSRSWPFPTDPKDLLVMSPFLSPGVLGRLPGTASRRTVISTTESLDLLTPDQRATFGRVFVVNPSMLENSVDDERGDQPPSGLHAKVYVWDTAERTRVLVGSANATESAFGGNVEFCVELSATTQTQSVKRMLTPGSAGVVTLRDLLEEYVPTDKQIEVDPEEQLAERECDRFRQRLASGPWTATVTADVDGAYQLDIDAPGTGHLANAELAARSWPITLIAERSQALASERAVLHFGSIALESISPFLAVETAVTIGGHVARAAFVVNATLVDAPVNRRQRILAMQLGTQREVLRYFLFLLSGLESETGSDHDPMRLLDRFKADGADDQGPIDLPLLEAMIRILARDPNRLDVMNGLVNELRASDDGNALLPTGFTDIWERVWALREETKKHRP